MNSEQHPSDFVTEDQAARYDVVASAEQVAPLPPAYTWADLLAFAQALTPEQLTQHVWGWNEEKCFNEMAPRVLEEDYASVDGEDFAPASDYTEQELQECDVRRLPAGTIVFQVED